MNKIAVLFPGHGTQYAGMGKTLTENYKAAAKVFEEAGNVLGYDLQKLVQTGSEKDFEKAEVLQPAILTTSIAFYQTSQAVFGYTPDVMAGHSLGELSAVCCAGGISLEDAVFLASERGRLMQEASAVIGEGAMCAVSGISVEELEEICRASADSAEPVVISNYNSPEQLVLSGLKASIDMAASRLKKAGAKIIPLKHKIPFHSRYMQETADRFLEILSKTAVCDTKIPIVSNVDGQQYQKAEEIKERLSKQIASPVKWMQCMQYMAGRGITHFIEMGPSQILNKIAVEIMPDANILSMDRKSDAYYCLDVLNQKKLFNKKYLLGRMLGVAVSVKNRNDNNEEYYNGVIVPYNQLSELNARFEASESQPDQQEVRQAEAYLLKILETKKAPAEEIKKRFTGLENETLISLSV